MDAVVVDGLDVTRGGRPVLEHLSFTIPSGKVTGLLGPSGCGKSTLMRAIVGVQQVQGGDVTVLGLPAGAPELRRRVGYVTQAPSVYADLTVDENLRHFAQIVGAPADDPARWPWRCSALRGCWCSTSPRWGSTPCCGATSGRPSTAWWRTGPRCSSRAT